MELTVKNLTVELAKKEIIKNLSLHVKNKQMVGLIGPNGSGKSTLLQTIYRINSAKSGTVHLDNMDVFSSKHKTLSANMSVVAQFNDTSFDFSVREMVTFGRTPHKKFLQTDSTEDEIIVKNALEKVGMSHFAQQSFLSLSGGEKQRVILARAIAQEPKLMILDEPTNHLDVNYQLAMLDTIKKLDISILAALHDLELAAKYCDYLYALKDGEIFVHGKPDEVLTKENIESLYGVTCEVYRKPFSNNLGIEYL